MRLVSTNLEGGLMDKAAKLDKHHPANTDVIATQETHATNQTINKIRFQMKRKWHVEASNGTSESRGVAIFLNKRTFPNQPITTKKDESGRWIWCLVEDGGGTKRVVGTVYAPATKKERVDFLEKLDLGLPEGIPAAIGGDWNTTWREGERSNEAKPYKEAVCTRALHAMAMRHCLADATRGPTQFTFRARNSNALAILDRWLINEEMKRWKIDTEVSPFP